MLKPEGSRILESILTIQPNHKASISKTHFEKVQNFEDKVPMG